MNTDNDILLDVQRKLARLRAEMVEVRRDVQHLLRDTGRQVRDHHELRMTLGAGKPGGLPTALPWGCPRCEQALTEIDRLAADNARQDRQLDHVEAWAAAWLGDLQLWVEAIGQKLYPKAHAFLGELHRRYPGGFGAVPRYRLPKRSPNNS